MSHHCHPTIGIHYATPEYTNLFLDRMILESPYQNQEINPNQKYHCCSNNTIPRERTSTNRSVPLQREAHKRDTRKTEITPQQLLHHPLQTCTSFCCNYCSLNLRPSWVSECVCSNEECLASIYTSLPRCLFMWGRPHFLEPSIYFTINLLGPTSLLGYPTSV